VPPRHGPSLHDGDVNTIEPGAILRHLVRRAEGRLWPTTLALQADADRWIELQNRRLSRAVEAKDAAEIMRLLALVDAQVARSTWFVGDELTIVDVLYSLLALPQARTMVPGLASLPALGAYLDAMILEEGATFDEVDRVHPVVVVVPRVHGIPGRREQRAPIVLAMDVIGQDAEQREQLRFTILLEHHHGLAPRRVGGEAPGDVAEVVKRGAPSGAGLVALARHRELVRSDRDIPVRHPREPSGQLEHDHVQSGGHRRTCDSSTRARSPFTGAPQAWPPARGSGTRRPSSRAMWPGCIQRAHV